jgi:site-specific recombinase XerC
MPSTACPTVGRSSDASALTGRRSRPRRTACDQWLEWKRSRGVKPSTLADYSHIMRRLKPGTAELVGANAELEQITPRDVERFRDALIASGASDWTANKYLGVLSDIFSWAKRRYGLSANPVADVECRPARKRGTSRCIHVRQT